MYPEFGHRKFGTEVPNLRLPPSILTKIGHKKITMQVFSNNSKLIYILVDGEHLSDILLLT